MTKNYKNFIIFIESKKIQIVYKLLKIYVKQIIFLIY